jgi:hypothetical protein
VANGAATSCSKATTVMPSRGLIVRTFEGHEPLLLHYYTKRSRSIHLSHARLHSLLLGSQACRHPLGVRDPPGDRCLPHGVGDPLVHVRVEGVGD